MESAWIVVVLMAVLPLLVRLGKLRGAAAAPSPKGIDEGLRARLGDALGSYLATTRALRGQVARLEAQATTMLRDEASARTLTGRRPVGRDIDDADLLDAIRKVQRAGERWIEQGERLDPQERAHHGLELDGLVSLLAIPWTVELMPTGQHRSDELRVVVQATTDLGRALATIDDLLSAAQGPYR
ncbi:MAG: hypothetical protein KC501_16615 [Myxococcales bacterium]|nr:hypothetical protein [Myxococcales bacterium]